MKKILLIFAASATLALTSCGGSNNATATTSNEANVDSLATAFEAELGNAQDSSAVADLIGKATENIKNLEAKGDTAAVKAYKWKLQELIDKNKDKFQGMNVASAISEISDVENLSKQVVNAAKTDTKTAADDAADATATAVKNDGNVKEAKAKIEETQKKVEETKKAVDDVKSAAKNAKEALNNLKNK